MKKQLSNVAGFIILVVSGIISFIISMSNPILKQAELGAMFNLVIPIFSTAAVLVIYGLMLSFREARNIIVGVLCFVNIVVGIYLYNTG